jgi:Leucine-rich repeat (LRR) protein
MLDLPKLTFLNLSGNNLKLVPELQLCSRLETLILSKNQIKNIDLLHNFTLNYLSKLDISFNELPKNYLEPLSLVLREIDILIDFNAMGNEVSTNQMY